MKIKAVMKIIKDDEKTRLSNESAIILTSFTHLTYKNVKFKMAA